MAKLQGFRLVNVRANNNKLIYIDEYFDIKGENTLIDMKNGGGKTLAVQMFFQTIIPNLSFDNQKKIIRLFDSTPKGSTIHVVSHFKTDNTQFENLYLGFCVTTQPKNSDEFSEQEDIGLKYMNYIIEANDNIIEDLDIHRLPLCIEKNKIIETQTYSKLYDFLNKQMQSVNFRKSYNVRIFNQYNNNKRKYINELRKFEIHAEVYELLASINKNENYVETFFSEKCKNSKDLFLNFILENTQKAMKIKNLTINEQSSLQTDDLAENIYDKAESLKKLNEDINQKKELEKFKDVIKDNLATTIKESENIQNYNNHLSQYPQQLSRIINQENIINHKIEENALKIDTAQQKEMETQEKIKNIQYAQNVYKLNKIESNLSQKEDLKSTVEDELKTLNTKLDEMKAVNLVFDYKKEKAIVTSIDEILEKLTNDNYDKKAKLSEYANALYEICSKDLHIIEENLSLSQKNKDTQKAKETALRVQQGSIEQQKNQNQNSISEFLKQKEVLQTKISEIMNDISEFENFSGSLFDESELDFLNRELQNLKDELQNMDITQLALDIKDKEHEHENNQKDIATIKIDNQRLQCDIDEYEDSLENIIKRTKADTSNSIEKIRDENIELFQKNIDKIQALSIEIEEINQEIQVLNTYGYLRPKNKFEALNEIKALLGFAQFGSDALKDMQEKDCMEILHLFPAFAECIIISDEDFAKVVNKKVRFTVSVLKELFVFLPISCIQNKDFISDKMYLLSRDEQYYAQLLNPEESILQRSKLLEKKIKQRDFVSGEKDILDEQIKLIQEHLAKFNIDKINEARSKKQTGIDNIEKIKLENIKLERDINQLAFEKERIESRKLEAQESIEIFINKIKLLELKIKNTDELITLEEILTDKYQEKDVLATDLKDNQSMLNELLSYISQEELTFKQYDEEKRIVLQQIEQVKTYVDKNIKYDIVDTVQNLKKLFEVAKKDFENTTDYDEQEKNRQESISKMEEIKADIVFDRIDFDKIYKINVNQKINNDTLRSQDRIILQKTKILEEYISEINTISIEKGKQSQIVASLEAQIVKIMPNYKDLDVMTLQDEYNIAQTESKDILNELVELRAIEKNLNEKAKILEIEQNSYKVFCVNKNLEWKNVTPSNEIISYEDISLKNKDLERIYNNAKNKINTESTKTIKEISKIKINESIKEVIKDNLVKTDNANEILSRISPIESFLLNIDAMISNLQTSIDGLKGIDEEIAKQLVRIIIGILGEISNIQNYSKAKFKNTVKETIKINIHTNGGCRYSDELIDANIKKYIYDLANEVKQGELTKDMIKIKLAPKNLINHAIDFSKLKIEILKLDNHETRYYNWGNLLASAGEGYVTYIMFIVCMIKYFYNVSQPQGDKKSDILVFLDNPFSSSSGVLLWEPIKQFLINNNAQLLCTAHNPPNLANNLFKRHIIIEQFKNSEGQVINKMRNQKIESKENIQQDLYEQMKI